MPTFTTPSSTPRVRPTRRRRRIASLLLGLGILLPGLVQAQSGTLDLEPVTRTLLIRNATVVQAPGRVLEGGSVLVRNGLIVEVGTDIEPPFDADVLQADSLYVYAGFIDGLSHIGVPEPEASTERPQVERPGDPPPDVAGIRPGRSVVPLLEHDERSIAPWRAQGLTLTRTTPYGRMLPGTTALLLLGEGEAEAMVYRAPHSLVARFAGAEDVYPATPLGIMATWRKLYRNAELMRTRTAAYDDAPAGRARPAFDPVLQAFIPVVAGEMPVVFRTESALEARRALSLSDELGFVVEVAGLEEAARILPMLRDREPPLFLSLDLPDAFSADSAQTASARADSAAAASGRPPRTVVSDDLEAERARLALRKQAALEEALSAPAALHDAGVRFGFTTLGVRPREFRPALRRLIDHGLTEDAALAALTTDAATLLGIDSSAGSVDPGKLANLVLTTGPFFDEDTRIYTVMIEGRPYEYDPPAPSSREAVDSAWAGTWGYTLNLPERSVTGRLMLEMQGGQIAGTIHGASPEAAVPIENLSLSGDSLRFAFPLGLADQVLDVQITLVRSGDELTGTGTAPPYGPVAFEAVRLTEPE